MCPNYRWGISRHYRALITKLNCERNKWGQTAKTMNRYTAVSISFEILRWNNRCLLNNRSWKLNLCDFSVLFLVFEPALNEACTEFWFALLIGSSNFKDTLLLGLERLRKHLSTAWLCLSQNSQVNAIELLPNVTNFNTTVNGLLFYRCLSHYQSRLHQASRH